MIYTVTINPSLDYLVTVKDFKMGATNRTSSELLLPGGKGINVSTVLKSLEVDSTALGFVAGFTGDELVKRVEKQQIKADFIKLPVGETRINVKLKDAEGTEINGQGPSIDKKYVDKLYAKLENLSTGDMVILAGSIPGSVSNSLYKDIMERLTPKGVEVVVDATKDLLTNVLPLHPFLVKPNEYELSEIFGVELTSREEVIPYAKKLQEMGAKNVLVSMAGKGSVLVAEDGIVISEDAPKGELINGVGAGDSMVAGFVAGWLKYHSYELAYRLGAAAGSASAFSEILATKDEIESVYCSTWGNVI